MQLVETLPWQYVRFLLVNRHHEERKKEMHQKPRFGCQKSTTQPKKDEMSELDTVVSAEILTIFSTFLNTTQIAKTALCEKQKW